ncbi:glycine oxidase ThiO [Kushneria indalinina]|uniref:Glycine oxidase n=1 Tax=Kushneria indalinina DSM 14324 TaxID=1122140 RepID=A0A3D9DV36_9GAMM|nr:glycine oxidase ThiO [Kushneria indalinina]REC94541.1 glycine oxidase [Kushneria indalinina DSM 14324]
MKTSDVIVVGGGINGMMSAFKLIQKGFHVTLLERGQCAREASWAGGGILIPLYPWRYADPIARLDALAAPQWLDLADRLAATTGIDPQYTPHGIMHVRVEDAHKAQAWSARHHDMLTPLSSSRAHELLGRSVTSSLAPAFWIPGRGSIRTPRLGQALRQWLVDHPRATLVEHFEVTALLTTQGRVEGVEGPQGKYLAPRVVMAGGPWTRQLLVRHVQLPISPVRGQMLLFRAERALLQAVMLMNGFYLIPRRDHHILAGSTFEDAGFDRATTAEGYEQIHARALEMLPALKEVEVTHHWAGLRPGSPDSIPFVGAVKDPEGLYVNAGHGGNGVVLSPATADLLCAHIAGTPPPVEPAPYAVPRSG